MKELDMNASWLLFLFGALLIRRGYHRVLAWIGGIIMMSVTLWLNRPLDQSDLTAAMIAGIIGALLPEFWANIRTGLRTSKLVRLGLVAFIALVIIGFFPGLLHLLLAIAVLCLALALARNYLRSAFKFKK